MTPQNTTETSSPQDLEPNIKPNFRPDFGPEVGWFDFKSLYAGVVDYLEATLKSKSPVVAEVGVYKGKSFFYLCELLDKKFSDWTAIAVDLWSDNYYFLDQDTRNVPNKFYEDFMETLSKKPYKDKVIVRRDYSWEVPSTLTEGGRVLFPIDFTFIDGDHSFSAVSKDLKEWHPISKLMAGHDYGQEGVVRAVRSHFENWFTIAKDANQKQSIWCWIREATVGDSHFIKYLRDSGELDFLGDTHEKAKKTEE